MHKNLQVVKDAYYGTPALIYKPLETQDSRSIPIQNHYQHLETITNTWKQNKEPRNMPIHI